jgi:hypothetical protein
MGQAAGCTRGWLRCCAPALAPRRYTAAGCLRHACRPPQPPHPPPTCPPQLHPPLHLLAGHHHPHAAGRGAAQGLGHAVRAAADGAGVPGARAPPAFARPACLPRPDSPCCPLPPPGPDRRRLPFPRAPLRAQKGIVCPNKHASLPEVMYKGHLLESETYIGGKVGCWAVGLGCWGWRGPGLEMGRGACLPVTALPASLQKVRCGTQQRQRALLSTHPPTHPLCCPPLPRAGGGAGVWRVQERHPLQVQVQAAGLPGAALRGLLAAAAGPAPLLLAVLHTHPPALPVPPTPRPPLNPTCPHLKSTSDPPPPPLNPHLRPTTTTPHPHPCSNCWTSWTATWRTRSSTRARWPWSSAPTTRRCGRGWGEGVWVWVCWGGWGGWGGCGLGWLGWLGWLGQPGGCATGWAAGGQPSQPCAWACCCPAGASRARHGGLATAGAQVRQQIADKLTSLRDTPNRWLLCASCCC